jgi:hypothetical protein
MNLLPGQQWQQEIPRVLKTSDFVLLFFSRNSVTKTGFAQREFKLARDMLSELPAGIIHTIPVRLDDCNIPEQFADLQWCNLFEPEGFDLLEQAIQAGLSQRGRDFRSADAEETIRIRNEKAALDFEYNLKKRFTLQCLELRNLMFFGNLAWTFQPRVNVLLGRNGYGKSHLMRCIISLLQIDRQRSNIFFKNAGNNSFANIYLQSDDADVVIHRDPSWFEESVGKVPVLAIPDSRFVNQSVTAVTQRIVETGKLREVGAHHFLYQEPYEPRIQTFLYDLCLEYLDHGKTFKRPIFKLIEQVVQQLTGSMFSFHNVARLESASFEITVLTEGNEDNPLPIQYASQGTLSVLAMFGLIYSYLKSVFGQRIPEDELLSQRAVVFIDELDAHLHPIWQYKIIGLLREHFPNIQFIVTAHSPLVVGGCLNDEVAVLRRDKDNRFIVEQFVNDFIGWRPEEIYEKVFQVEGTDESYQYYLALYPFKDKIQTRVNELNQKENLIVEEEEERRALRQKLYYLDKVHSKQDERDQYRQLLMENRSLRRELEILKQSLGNG